METSLKEFKALLEKFSSINYVRPKTNLFQVISGAESHYEKFVSNVLAFFLDANESHGLGTLLLDALLDAAGRSGEIPEYGEYTVEREWVARCESNKYIDIFIAGDEDKVKNSTGGAWAMAIENKLWVNIYNPLDCYCSEVERYISNLGEANKTSVCILLSMHSVNVENIKGFVSVTYNQLARVLRKMLNPFDYPNTKYTQLLVDLFDHISNIEKGGVVMDKELARFLFDNRVSINNLLDAINIIRKSLKEQAQEVHVGVINKLKEWAPNTQDAKQTMLFFPSGWTFGVHVHFKPGHGVSSAAWRSSFAQIAFFEFAQSDECIIVFDVYLYIDGRWEVYLFPRNQSAECYELFEHMVSGGPQKKDGPVKYKVFGEPPEHAEERSSEEKADIVLSLIKKLII